MNMKGIKAYVRVSKVQEVVSALGGRRILLHNDY